MLVARGVVNGEQLRTEFTDLTVQATVTDTRLFDLRSIRYLIQTSDRGIPPQTDETQCGLSADKNKGAFYGGDIYWPTGLDVARIR